MVVEVLKLLPRIATGGWSKVVRASKVRRGTDTVA